MRLDSENPSESQIMIPAKEKLNIDWDTVDRLVKVNKDFLNYIDKIHTSYKTSNPIKDSGGWLLT